MEVKVLPVGPIGTNCYLVKDGTEALIIDPGEEADRIQKALSEEGIAPKAILLTHAHFDHIGAVDDLRKRYNLEVYLHEMEHPWLDNPELNGSLSLLRNQIRIEKADKKLEEGFLKVGAFSFEVIHTPGHSPGSVSFAFHKEKFIFGGDVLFREGIGRTDLREGNMEQLAATIRNRLYTLDENYTVYPGHGPHTTIGHEKRNNPFIR